MKHKTKTLKVGDLVTWKPDGDIGVVTNIDEDELRYQVEDPNREEDFEPYWIQWRDDPVANGWHDLCSPLYLLSSP